MSAPKLPHAPPANDPPQYRTLASIAEEFHFKSPRAARDWCRSRRIPYHRDGKFNWVDRNAVMAAIARGAVYTVREAPAPPSVAGWVDATLGGGSGT